MSDAPELIFSGTTVVLDEESDSPEDDEETASDSVASLVSEFKLKENEVKGAVVGRMVVVNVTVVTATDEPESVLDFPGITVPKIFSLATGIAEKTDFPTAESSDPVVALAIN